MVVVATGTTISANRAKPAPVMDEGVHAPAEAAVVVPDGSAEGNGDGQPDVAVGGEPVGVEEPIKTVRLILLGRAP